jgi:hypothetical protein
MSDPKTTVPKFASFRAKPAPTDKIEEERHKSGSNDRESSRHRRHRSRSRERTRHETRPARDESLWVIDRKGDVKNLIYGSIHKYSVPPFHRIGAGGVLGAPSGMKIDRDYGDEKGIVLVNPRDSKLYSRDKYIFSKLEKEKPRLLKIRPELLVERSTEGELDFISLTTRGRKRKRAEVANTSDSEDDETNYRSIHGKSKLKDEPTDDTFQYATESESSGPERTIKLDDTVKQKTIQLSRKVEQSPHDIDAWLALIEHQDTLIQEDGRRRVTNAEIRSTADIKIHMYEKALEKARSLHDREKFLLGLMTEGSKVWEVKAQAARWEQISKENIDSLVLWKSYVNFKQATFANFRWEEVREVFVKRIKLLLGTISSAKADTLDSFYKQLLYVLLRFTIFTRESGYSELAIAIWQGLLEFNFFAPPSSGSHEEKVASFREFWDSEVPRIGEDGAQGWLHFVTNSSIAEPPDALADETQDLLDNKYLFESWAKAERLRSHASRLPARTMDEVVEDDPFRVILVSDIEDFLIYLPSQSENLRKSLLNAFLLSCRLPPLVTDDKETSEISTDPFIGGELLEADAAWINRKYSSTSHSPKDDTKTDMSYILKTPSSNFPASPESAFGVTWFKSLPVWQDKYAGDNGPLTYSWIRNTLKQLIPVHPHEDLAEYYLSFEWRNEPETIKKISKGLLKQHPSSLRLYNAYAMIEWSRGNKGVSNGVFSAALNMSKSMSEDKGRDSIILWKSWIWASLEESDHNAALSRLFSIADCTLGDTVNATPAILLRTRQHISSNRDFYISSGHLDHAVLYAECLALLEYLSPDLAADTISSNQGNIDAALSSYTKFSQTLVDRNLGSTTSHELFLQSASRLLYHHARIGPFRPALIREHLTNFLTLFPRNTIFLSLYVFNESRMRIDNRVRMILVSKVLTPENDTLTSRLFAIYYEINYGTIHSVRSAFEHALSSPSSKSSAGLWRFYILYVLQTPQFRPQAKEIWHRALRACPWAKELYVIGFEKLDGLVEFAELRRTWRVMGEKELRVHVDLEDKFDRMRELEENRVKRLTE